MEKAPTCFLLAHHCPFISFLNNVNWSLLISLIFFSISHGIHTKPNSWLCRQKILVHFRYCFVECVWGGGVGNASSHNLISFLYSLSHKDKGSKAQKGWVPWPRPHTEHMMKSRSISAPADCKTHAISTKLCSTLVCEYICGDSHGLLLQVSVASGRAVGRIVWRPDQHEEQESLLGKLSFPGRVKCADIIQAQQG